MYTLEDTIAMPILQHDLAMYMRMYTVVLYSSAHLSRAQCMHSRLSEQHSAMAIGFKVDTNILLAGFVVQKLYTSGSHHYL
jgi:hypothetical protein